MRPWFTIRQDGEGPLLAVALHDGHDLRPEIERCSVLSDAERLREEDPFTGAWTQCAPVQVVVHRSRFEADLNRPRDRAIYTGPADAWGLDVWRAALGPAEVATSLAGHDDFYETLSALLDRLLARHARLVLLDLHSYNHRRAGPDRPPAAVAENPEVNLGTGTLDRALWGDAAAVFTAELAGRGFDVRENVKFQGGYLSRWTHATFGGRVGVLAVEFKKTFMDEWTGAPDHGQLLHIDRALRAVSARLLALLERPM